MSVDHHWCNVTLWWWLWRWHKRRRYVWTRLNTYVGLDPRFAGVSLFRTIDVPPALITVVPDPATWRANNVFSTSCMTKNTSAACSTAWKQKEWESTVLFMSECSALLRRGFAHCHLKFLKIFFIFASIPYEHHINFLMEVASLSRLFHLV